MSTDVALRGLSTGRTLFRRPNDTWRAWLDRLLFGTRWETEPRAYECVYGGHRFVSESPVSPSDATASNLATLYLAGPPAYFCPERLKTPEAPRRCSCPRSRRRASNPIRATSRR